MEEVKILRHTLNSKQTLGQVVLPMLLTEVVETGWITEAQFFQGKGICYRVDLNSFISGFALAQSMPGPLFNFASFIGAVYLGMASRNSFNLIMNRCPGSFCCLGRLVWSRTSFNTCLSAILAKDSSSCLVQMLSRWCEFRGYWTNRSRHSSTLGKRCEDHGRHSSFLLYWGIDYVLQFLRAVGYNYGWFVWILSIANVAELWTATFECTDFARLECYLSLVIAKQKQFALA